jgi:hypothetical protein
MTERRFKPPVIHILFNPGAHNFTRGDIKKSFDKSGLSERPAVMSAFGGKADIPDPST